MKYGGTKVHGMNIQFIIIQLAVSIVGGVIAGLIVTWIIKHELHLSKEALRRIFTKEVAIVIIIILGIAGYAILVKKGILPAPEFHDYMEVYRDGKRYTLDACHPERPLIPQLEYVGPGGSWQLEEQQENDSGAQKVPTTFQYIWKHKQESRNNETP